MSYDPEIATMGFQVTATLEKPGYRVKKRKIQARKVGKKHLLTREECIKFFEENFGVKVVE